MARALRELLKGAHDITFLAERFRRDISDVDWIADLSKEGQWIIISTDRRITRNRAEYHAFRNSNLIGLFLSQGLNKASRMHWHRSPAIRSLLSSARLCLDCIRLANCFVLQIDAPRRGKARSLAK